MGKKLKSCTVVLLRADLTGHGHPTHFGSFCPVHISGLSQRVRTQQCEQKQKQRLPANSISF